MLTTNDPQQSFLTSADVMQPSEQKLSTLHTTLDNHIDAINNAAMQCYEAAALFIKTNPKIADMHLKHAERLTRSYTALMNMRSKHLRNGKQTITIQHVNVSDGGQAIVGNVTSQREGKKK